MKNNYWIDRIANNTYKTYNSLEEKNRALMEMYQEASLNIQEELYSVTQKINGGKGVTLSDMHKFNRLSGLKKNIENTLEKLTENVEKFGTVNMVNAGKSVYKNVMGQIDGTSFDMPNQRVMEEMLNRPWHGDTFSKRLWKNTQVLASNLNEILTIGLTQGKTIAEIAIQLNNRMNAGFNTSHRLIRTETMHYLNESAFKAYKDSGCEEVEVYCAKDERTCEVCGKKHGKKYKIDKRPVLPFHPNCRCTYLPVINMKKVEENNRIIKEELEKINRELTRLKSSKGPLPKRHVLSSIGKKSTAKTKNTIIMPWVDYNKDIESIKNGEYNKVKDSYEINGRIYGVHDGRFYPISGEGFVTLTRDEYKLLIKLKTEYRNPKVFEFLENMGANKETINKLVQILKEGGVIND